MLLNLATLPWLSLWSFQFIAVKDMSWNENLDQNDLKAAILAGSITNCTLDVVISSGGVVDIDALQMAWSQRVLSILLDTGDSHVLQGAWFQHVLNLARCECSKIGWDEMRKRQTHVHTH